MFALVFEAAEVIPAPVELALPKVLLECLSCLFDRKTGIAGVVVLGEVWAVLAGGGWAEAGMPPGGWEAFLPTHTRGVWAPKCCSWASWARAALA